MSLPCLILFTFSRHLQILPSALPNSLIFCCLSPHHILLPGLYTVIFPCCCICGSFCLHCLLLSSLVNSYSYFKSYSLVTCPENLLSPPQIALIFSSPVICPSLTYICFFIALTTGNHHLFMCQCPPLVYTVLESRDHIFPFSFISLLPSTALRTQ